MGENLAHRLRGLPSVSALLQSDTAQEWLTVQPRGLVVDCIREALDGVRQRALAMGPESHEPLADEAAVLELAARRLHERSTPRLRGAVNATGIILHTGMGRAVWPESVVEGMCDDLKTYCTLAIDRRSGQRMGRHRHVEDLLCELTGAQAATVVNNNAAAALLVLTALCQHREVIVSRGQLIEIGGSFRLPDVMTASGATLVEVGTTNRTHLPDYERAIGEQTAALLRVHPSNYRIVGFQSEVPVADLADLARRRGVMLIDDLGSGALVDLRTFGLEYEPTAADSIAAGADVTLFSADKLIGASQGGIIVGRSEIVEKIRQHPLARALRVDKTCLMALERTLMLFRDPVRLAIEHPLYRMLAAEAPALADRANRLADGIRLEAGPVVHVEVVESTCYLGSGSLPAEALPSRAVRLRVEALEAGELAVRLRLDDACVFGRIEHGWVVLDVRTVWEHQLGTIVRAVVRCSAGGRAEA